MKEIKNKKILIIVDMQNDFITGSLANKDAEAIVDPICKYLKKNKDKFSKVILTRDTHQTNYLETSEGKNLPIEHCIKGTNGWLLNDKIQNTLDTEKIDYLFIDKPTFGFKYWYGQPELAYPEIKNIEICGTCTDICVVSNALILKTQFPEKEVKVLSKLCAGLTPELHEAALKIMQSCQCKIV